MNIEQSENEAADAVIDYVMALVKYYVDNPGDLNAAMVAVLVTALEKVMDKHIYIEKLLKQ